MLMVGYNIATHSSWKGNNVFFLLEPSVLPIYSPSKFFFTIPFKPNDYTPEDLLSTCLRTYRDDIPAPLSVQCQLSDPDLGVRVLVPGRDPFLLSRDQLRTVFHFDVQNDRDDVISDIVNPFVITHCAQEHERLVV